MKVSVFERLVSRKTRLKRLKNKVIDYLSGLPEGGLQADQKDVLHFLQHHDINIFPYDFTSEYNPSAVKLFYDRGVKLLYTLWEGKKLYYKNGSQKKKAQKYFNSLRLEQDIRSPHRYLTEEFTVNQNDVIVDVGAAEGNFSLSIIEQAGHVYLFEPDKNWVKALNATFAPWSNKVTIVPKFVSDKSSAQTIALDEYFTEAKSINFIKADVEGAEAQILKGASNIMARHKNLKIAICTYHRQEDAAILDSALRALGFRNQFSDGYMLYYYGRTNVVKEPYLRKAVLRAVKE